MQTEYLPYRVYQADRCIEKKALSAEGLRRLRALERFEFARSEGVSSAVAARLIGIPRSTLYDWRRRFQWRVQSLEPRPRRPKRLRRACWSTEALVKLKRLRQEFPVWGKKKLHPLMVQSGFKLSQSTVGRMLGVLVMRGEVWPAPRLLQRSPHRRLNRPWAQRLARGQRLKGILPGDAVQIDTMAVHPAPGVEFKHFNAYCTVSRWNVAEVYTRATAISAAAFLRRLISETPFPIRALQIDGGSEFMAEFEQACQDASIPLSVLAPKSPEMNGGVERVNKTWRDELYNLYDDLPATVAELRPEVREQQLVMNHIRPHEGLNLLTPAEYLRRHHPEWAPQSEMS